MSEQDALNEKVMDTVNKQVEELGDALAGIKGIGTNAGGGGLLAKVQIKVFMPDGAALEIKSVIEDTPDEVREEGGSGE